MVLWTVSHKMWNRLMHALHGNGTAVDEEDDFDQALADYDEDGLREIEILMDGYYQVVPALVLRRIEDGTAAAAMPAWSVNTAGD